MNIAIICITMSHPKTLDLKGKLHEVKVKSKLNPIRIIQSKNFQKICSNQKNPPIYKT